MPDWNIEGLIPSIAPGQPGHSSHRSPYKIGIVEFVSRFAINEKRCRLIDGLIRYRSELHRLGVTEGFQWIDGSFLEHIETRENREPNDIDVVTFFNLHEEADRRALHQLFDDSYTKASYFIDAYPFVLSYPMGEEDVKMIAYWYSMWSHTREGIWKGFVQIDLSEREDELARETLTQIMEEGGYEL